MEVERMIFIAAVIASLPLGLALIAVLFGRSDSAPTRWFRRNQRFLVWTPVVLWGALAAAAFGNGEGGWGFVALLNLSAFVTYAVLGPARAAESDAS